jgi:hypothetical protein
MIQPVHKTKTVRRPMSARSGDVHTRIAMSLLGQAVSLLVDAKTVTHGIVTKVSNEANVPKIVVSGTRYDLAQILTAAPASLGL